MSTAEEEVEEEEEDDEEEEVLDSAKPAELHEDSDDVKKYLSLHHVFEGI